MKSLGLGSPLLAGYTFTVQYRFKPTGSTKWTNWTTWQKAATSTNAPFVPSHGAGTYPFHASAGRHLGCPARRRGAGRLRGCLRAT
jgi:hypothetical protein